MSNIKLSVALPLFRSRDTAWIALESLCRQRHPGCDWELLVCEEVDEISLPFGDQALFAYQDRLRDVGCVEIKYFEEFSKLSLPNKWRKMVANADGEGFLLKAGDCFSQPLRLVETSALITEGAEWIDATRGYFYHLHSQTLVVFDTCTLRRRKRYSTGLNMCVRTELLSTMEPCEKERGIDGHLFDVATEAKGAGLTVSHLDSPSWRSGVDVDGVNFISLKRHRRMGVNGKLTRPFRAPLDGEAYRLDQVVPSLIAHKLEEMKHGNQRTSGVGLATCAFEPSQTERVQ